MRLGRVVGTVAVVDHPAREVKAEAKWVPIDEEGNTAELNVQRVGVPSAVDRVIETERVESETDVGERTRHREPDRGAHAGRPHLGGHPEDGGP